MFYRFNPDEDRDTSILYIDDSPAMLSVVSTVLRRAGFNIVTSNSPAMGNFLIHQEEPGMILLDVSLPGFSTEELIESFNFDNSKIILFSCLDVDHMQSMVISNDLGGCISKFILDVRSPLPFIEAITEIGIRNQNQIR